MGLKPGSHLHFRNPFTKVNGNMKVSMSNVKQHNYHQL